jgi:hypothetical protein
MTSTSIPVSEPAVAAVQVGCKADCGPVQFLVDGLYVGEWELNSSGSFTAQTDVAAGAHTLTVQYLGNTQYAPAVSNAVPFAVYAPTTTTLSFSPGSPAYNQRVALTATVSNTGSTTPTGTTTFLDGTAILGDAPLSGGAAVFSTSDLTVGVHSLSAIYDGDDGNTPSTRPSSR